MIKIGLTAAMGLALLIGTHTAVAQTFSEAASGSDRIQTGGGSGSPDLYGSGNDDGFQSYGITTFNMTAADFGVMAVSDITTVILDLTFNDRFFSDGTQFGLYFTSDDFDAAYTGLSYDAAGPNDPSGLDATQFANLTSLGTYATGFDTTDGANGGMVFNYSVNFAAVEADLIAEINAGSDFSLILTATDNADDITFSGVGNTFDPGDPALTITTAAAVPEPGSAIVLSLMALAGVCRRRR